MRIQEAAEFFKEKIHLNPPMRFSEVRVFDLPPYVYGMVKTVLDPLQIRWALGENSYNGFYCINCSDEKVHYLLVGPNSYMWCGESMNDSIPTDEVYVYLMKKYAGIDAEIDFTERSVVLKKDGKILEF